MDGAAPVRRAVWWLLVIAAALVLLAAAVWLAAYVAVTPAP